MWRRSSSASRRVTSSSPMRMRPLLGSIRRLIIFIVVVLPQPEGPTSITISPAGISRVMLSTAGADRASYRFVTPSSRMRAPPTPSDAADLAVDDSVVADSDTNSPWGGEAGDDVEHGIQDDCQDQDADGAGHDRVGRIGAAGTGDPREDVATEPGAEGERRDGGDTHQHLCRYPDAGHDHGPGQWQLEAHQCGEPAHSHSARRLDECPVDARETDHDVAQYGEEPEEHQHDHRRQHTDADDAHKHAEQGVRRDGQADGGERV